MTLYFDDCTACAKKIMDHVGKTIVIGVPLGLGKPIGILNALYRLACNDPSIHLTILTGLTFSRPILKNALEKKFIEPILDRLIGDYEDPLYESTRVRQKLPPNINVIEFFLSPGKFLHNAYVQQNYISSSYQYVDRDVANLKMNVLAQLVSPSKQDANLYSLSCNTDLFGDAQRHLKELELTGQKVAVIAEVNANLPYMYGETAEIRSDVFTAIVDPKKYRTLFAIPRDELSIQDNLIGLYTSTLIKDNGCLQIGIGKLSNALANFLILRHKDNAAYKSILNQLNAFEKFDNVIDEAGGVEVFQKGLYASTEMLSDEYLQLYNEKILKKQVYDHIGLQKLLNTQTISDVVTADMFNALIENHVINIRLTSDDIDFLKKFGIFKDDIRFDNDTLILPSNEKISADMNVSRQQIIDHCLGKQLKCGKLIHAGFFFGSVDFYAQLRKLSYDELQKIEMSAIARTNTLLWAPELLQLQRQNARFVNSSLMVTLVGGVISDGLDNYQEVSGVGGQFDFVSMANMLPDAHSIINCRSTYQSKQGVQSNIVWDYANSTISRYLRDFVVTEYGIADCRSKTDVEVIKSMLNIADSRFQPDLLKKAKKAGKISQDYEIPLQYQSNYPENLFSVTQKNKKHFQSYPFGSDLTPDEQVLAKALLYLKNSSKIKLGYLVFASLFFFKSDTNFQRFLQRMDLESPQTIQQFFYKKILKYAINKTLS